MAGTRKTGPDIAKPLHGFGASVLVVPLAYRGDAFRVVYAVQLADGEGPAEKTAGGAQMKSEKLELVRGSGNVFRDLGRGNADIEQPEGPPWG